MTQTEAIETRAAFKCEGGCDITEDEPQGGQYNCGNCGNTFSGGQALDEGKSRPQQCTQCNKFAAKQADYGCDSCGEEVSAIDAFVCPSCDELFETETEAREHCSEEAVSEREQAAEQRRIAATSVRVEERRNYPGSNAITYCDRDGKVLHDQPTYRAYLQPGTSFGITECVEHPLCQTAVETGKFCMRHQGPLSFKEVMHPTQQPSIRHGAPDGPCSDQPYIYMTSSGLTYREPEPDQLPERVVAWLRDLREQNAALMAEIGTLKDEEPA